MAGCKILSGCISSKTNCLYTNISYRHSIATSCLEYNGGYSKNKRYKCGKFLQDVKNKAPTGKTYINEDFSERTIEVNVHSEALKDTQLLIFDLGQQESYCILQAILLHLENSFFLLFVDLTRN